MRHRRHRPLAPRREVCPELLVKGSGWYNVAPWVDTLTTDQLCVLLLEDTYAADELCRELLTSWSNPGGVLEDAANRIDNDSDFRLLVDLRAVVRRLAGTRRQTLRDVYSAPALEDMLSHDVEHLREAAELAGSLLPNV